MSKNEKFKEIAEQLPELIGGKENVTYFSHCITRLRFSVKDRGLIDLDKIKQLQGVMGAQWSGEQLQVVIGAHVEDVYDILTKAMNIEKQNMIDENLDKSFEKKKFSVAGILDTITGCIAPIIPVMIACGMLKAILQLLSFFEILGVETQSYQILNFIGDTGFYFLPVIIGYTSAKKFNCNVIIGMAIGACLIHPNFTALINAGEPIKLFEIPVYSGYYPSSIFPMILTMAFAAPIERFITKWIPATLRYVLVPTLTLIIVAPLALIVLAPLGAYAGAYLSTAVIWLYETFGFVGCALLAAVYPLIIMTGMHTAFSPYIMNTLATLKCEPLILPTMHIANFNQIAACLAVGIKTKEANLKSSAFSCAVTALVGGVTEPAIFGITIPLKTPLYGCMIGGLVGGAFLGIMQVCVYTLPGAGTLFGLPAYIGGGNMNNLIWMAVSILLGMIVTFIVTLIIYKPAPVNK